MKLTKLLLSTVLACSMLAGCSSSAPKDRLEAIKEKGYIVLGTSPDYAPNEFYIANSEGKKEIVGTDIMLAQAIADEIGVELKISESDFNTVITNTQAGNIDIGISGFAWKKDRADVVNFSENYSRSSDLSTYQGLMVRKEDVAKFKDEATVKASKINIGAQVGSIQYEMALNLTDESHIVALGDTTSCAGMLSTGNIDAFVCTSTQAYALEEVYDDIVLLPREVIDMDPDNYYNRTGVIVQKDPSTDSLLELINNVIKRCNEVDDKGINQLDRWYEEATKLMDFEIPTENLNQYESEEQ